MHFTALGTGFRRLVDCNRSLADGTSRAGGIGVIVGDGHRRHRRADSRRRGEQLAAFGAAKRAGGIIRHSHLRPASTRDHRHTSLCRVYEFDTFAMMTNTQATMSMMPITMPAVAIPPPPTFPLEMA